MRVSYAHALKQAVSSQSWPQLTLLLQQKFQGKQPADEVNTAFALAAVYPALLDSQKLDTLVQLCAKTAEPWTVFVDLLTLVQRHPTDAAVWSYNTYRVVTALLGGSLIGRRLLLGHDAHVLALCRTQAWEVPISPTQLRTWMRQARVQAQDIESFEAAVRHMRTQTWLRIIGRALACFADAETTVLELSYLADAVVSALTRLHLRRERSQNGIWDANGACGFAVIAQGKLGAKELNVSSDIDLQFIVDRQGTLDPGTSESLARMTHVAQRVVRALSQSDSHGFGYRVDMNLRPEGQKGALVNSVLASENYYATFGQGWERLALIRARHIAGSRWVTEGWLLSLQSFIYPRHHDADRIEQIRNVVLKLHQAHAPHNLANAQGLDIKHCAGGIRDLELFVQLQQHMRGGRLKALQTGSMTHALQHLHLAGVLTLRHATRLQQIYWLFRRTENALQMRENQQTYSLPRTEADWYFLAKQLRWPKSPASLQQTLVRQTRFVHRLTRRLLNPRSAPKKGLTQIHALLEQSDKAQQDSLFAFGFKQTLEAQDTLNLLRNTPQSPFFVSSKQTSPPWIAALFRDISQSPDPDQALRLYADLEPRLRRHPEYFKWLEQIPALRRRLMDVLGTSELLGRTFIRFPELMDWLAATPLPQSQGLMPDTAAYVHTARFEVEALFGNLEAQLRALGKFKLREQLRIGLLDLAGVLDTREVGHQLSLLAQSCLQLCLGLAAQRLKLSQGPDLARALDVLDFAVLGLGRLGSEEMGYGSDLDILFLHRGDFLVSPDLSAPSLSATTAMRLAQLTIQHLTLHLPEGQLYSIDTRLRPSGMQGPLVSSASGFMTYHQKHAMLWERQALLRARCVAGDFKLGNGILKALDSWRYPTQLPVDTRQQMHLMRLRMQHENRPPPRETKTSVNIKSGLGGLVDFEFAVHALQLEHAHASETLKTTHTADALHHMAELGFVGKTMAQKALKAYWFIRRLENALRIVHGQPASVVDFNHPNAQALARRMGRNRHMSKQALANHWQRMRKHLHQFYRHVLRVE